MIQYIKNSQNENICLQIFEPLHSDLNNKLAILCHGITGYKEQDVILQTAKTLSCSGYLVITFDCRNSRGESFNNHRCASLTSMYEDLQTVTAWVKTQNFYTEPFLLAGHSLGGSTVLHYAQNHPKSINGLILLSTIFDGDEFVKNTSSAFLQQLQNGGIIRSRNNIDCYLDDTYLTDFKKYDFYNHINQLTMPILLITGDNDTASTPENNERFYQRIQGKKYLFILKNCTHIYDTPQNLSDLEEKITKFI